MLKCQYALRNPILVKSGGWLSGPAEVEPSLGQGKGWLTHGDGLWIRRINHRSVEDRPRAIWLYVPANWSTISVLRLSAG